MYFCDKNGILWFKTNVGFQNVGLAVKEKLVSFRRIDAINPLPGSLVVPAIADPLPITLRQAISQYGITEENPLLPLNNLNYSEVFNK